MRCPGLLALALLPGCGLLIDGGYLLSSKTTTVDERQTRPTGLSEVHAELEVRAEQGQLWLACEELERPVERRWTVRKTYEYQGGFPDVHWFAVLLEGVVAGGVTLGVGLQCTRPQEALSCAPLWWTVPLWLDAAYSAVRALTIERPVLVQKERRDEAAGPGEVPLARRTVACPPDARLVAGRSTGDPLAVVLPVDAWGRVAPGQVPRLVEALRRAPEVRVFALGSGGQPRPPEGAPRCDVLRGLGYPCPSG